MSTMCDDVLSRCLFASPAVNRLISLTNRGGMLGLQYMHLWRLFVDSSVTIEGLVVCSLFTTPGVLVIL